MNTRDWIVTESVRKQIDKEIDAAFTCGYVVASIVMGTAMAVLHWWGIV